MSHDQPVVLSEESVTMQRWDDDVRGHLAFRTLFGEDAGATAAISAGVAYLQPGEWLGRHRHSATEIYFVIDGNATMTLDGDDHDAAPGTAIFVPGDTEHGIRNTGTTILRFFYAFDVGNFADVRYRFPTIDY